MKTMFEVFAIFYSSPWLFLTEIKHSCVSGYGQVILAIIISIEYGQVIILIFTIFPSLSRISEYLISIFPDFCIVGAWRNLWGGGGGGGNLWRLEKNFIIFTSGTKM